MGDEDFKIDRAVGFLGAGNMSSAIAFGLFKKGVLDPKKVTVSGRTQTNLKSWEAFGCKTTTDNLDVWKNSEIIVCAVKPQILPGVVDKLERDLGGDGSGAKINISVMAGVSLEKFGGEMKRLSKNSRCFRVMPNIGLKVGSGVAVFAGPEDTSEEERRLLFSFFKPNGLCYEVPEGQINAYCGLFGSGIGFMFPIMEALSDGAVKMGIPREISLEIAAQVMKGAGELVLAEKLHPGVMKDKVCSPGGTTIAGVAELEKGGVRAAVINAVEAATVRGEVLGAKK